MNNTNSKVSSKERLFSKIITERRATPSFDGSPIPKDILAAIVKAGMESPSGYNLQPWRFIIVSDKEQKRRLREAAMGQPKVEEASAVIVCCGDLNAPRGQSLDGVLRISPKNVTNAILSTPHFSH